MQINNYDSLLNLLIEQKFESDLPAVIARLKKDDIKIPGLNRAIQLAILLEQDTIVRRNGLPWETFYKDVQRKKRDPLQPMLYLQEPEGGFNALERFEVRQLDEKYNLKIPLPIAGEFEGLTDLEARVALAEQQAIGAKLVGETFRPDLHEWLKDAAQKTGIDTPRLVITESDLPCAAALSLPRIPATVLISANMVEILSTDQLKAVIGHELDHVKKRKSKDEARHQYVNTDNRVEQMFTSLSFGPNTDYYGKEYEADEHGARLTSCKIMKEALVVCDKRAEELADFSMRLREVFKSARMKPKQIPSWILSLMDFDDRSKPVDISLQETYRGNGEDDDHPPTSWRLKNLNEKCDGNERK
jgi:Zn-dependent protease with chaperone function